MKKTTLIFFSALLCAVYAYGQPTSRHIVAFYNVENLFHPSEDSLVRDDDFTPTGLYHWSYKKYYHKIANVAKVFLAMGQGNPPSVIGLAEIENERVLEDLCYHSPLNAYHYRYVHHDSPDRRGIDVALLYRDSCVKVLRERKVPVVFPFEPNTQNRDLLYALVRFLGGDSLHIVVNHWTSRFGGYAATIPKRNYYADVARSIVDSILTLDPDANILLMGDFNDYATDQSLEQHLRARKYTPDNLSDTLFNLMYYFVDQNNVGSHKHEDFWGCLDQMVVSRGFLFDKGNIHILDKVPHIFQALFLLVPDEKYGGTKTFRTFSGPRYIGGYADHLPVYVVVEEDAPLDNKAIDDKSRDTAEQDHQDGTGLESDGSNENSSKDADADE